MSRCMTLLSVIALVFLANGAPQGGNAFARSRSRQKWNRCECVPPPGCCNPAPSCCAPNSYIPAMTAPTSPSLADSAQPPVPPAPAAALPTPAPTGPYREGYQALFNGKDLTGWKGLIDPPARAKLKDAAAVAAAQTQADKDMRDHWSVVDGVLVFDGKGKNLCTVEDYGDFELLVDWKILAGGDSGIYLRGNPQVQIWDPDWAKYKTLGADKGSGALWNNAKHDRFPLVKADNPVGQWNHFRIIMVGEKVTVYLNDKLVVKDTVMENFWNKGATPIAATGSIELQNHGNTLYFKDVFVKRLGK